jgi:hypothetical protein
MALLLVLWLIVSVPVSLVVARMIGRNGILARTGPPTLEWSELLDRPVEIELEEIPRVGSPI